MEAAVVASALSSQETVGLLFDLKKNEIFIKAAPWDDINFRF